jgi:hypothetical protein
LFAGGRLKVGKACICRHERQPAVGRNEFDCGGDCLGHFLDGPQNYAVKDGTKDFGAIGMNLCRNS